jgi:hypothetical protein
MKYLKENWQELCIVSIAVFVIGTIMICTWKYSNYSLYDRISMLEDHTNRLARQIAIDKECNKIEFNEYGKILQREINDVNYRVDVLEEMKK